MFPVPICFPGPFTHDCRDTLLTALKEDMVIHEYPCIDENARLGDLLTEALQEPGPVLIVIKDG
jgi:hypothetical protein